MRRYSRSRGMTGLLAAIVVVLVLAPLANAFEFGPLKGPVHGDGNRALLVILHGDGGPGRYDKMAAALAKAVPGSTVVALNRPGYGNGKYRSPGRGGASLGDLYTKPNNDALAQTLIAMRASLKPRKLIVMGHSGGSGQMGSVIGRYPGIADSVVLVSCPCDVPKWRISRPGAHRWPLSQSPLDHVGGISPHTRIIVVIGANDDNTRLPFSREYVAAAKAAGKSVSMVVIPNGNHFWSTLEPTVTNILVKEMR
ncbi:MAG: alpha/beta fold hydrolase [Rhodobacteraceae bacterium]|nr:alpha/beta fold hydrolase [Paracoccaceae bacterium]